MTCSLCDPSLGPVIAESKHWKLILNTNQSLLGKCFLVVRRHIESITDHTTEEWTDLHSEICRAIKMINSAFVPDHYNYAFLQNQDPHVHLHILPRYASRRTFEGVEFEADFPGPWPARRILLSDEQNELLAKHIQGFNT